MAEIFDNDDKIVDVFVNANLEISLYLCNPKADVDDQFSCLVTFNKEEAAEFIDAFTQKYNLLCGYLNERGKDV